MGQGRVLTLAKLTHQLAVLLISLRLAAAFRPYPIGPTVEQDRQVRTATANAVQANWELAYAMDLDQFQRTSTERLSKIMSEVLIGARVAFQLISLQQSAMSSTSELFALSNRLLESRAKLDSTHVDAVDYVTDRVAPTWMKNFEHPYTVVAANSRLLDNTIGTSIIDRADMLKRIREAVLAEPNSLLTIWEAMTGGEVGPRSMLQLAVDATDGDWRRSLTFLLAMARVAVRSGELVIAETIISQEGGISFRNENLMDAQLHNWTMRLDMMARNLKLWSGTIRNRWESRLESEIKKFIQVNGMLNTSLFTLSLHDHLFEMYPWRHWFVIAYYKMPSGTGHTGRSFSSCGGVTLLDVLPDGRSLTVASSETASSRFNAELASAVLEAAQRDGPVTDDAAMWLHHVSPQFGSGCVTASFVGAVCYGRCQAVWTAQPDRLAYKRMSVGAYLTHFVVFG